MNPQPKGEKETKHDWLFRPSISRFSQVVMMLIAAFIGSRIGWWAIPSFIAGFFLAYLLDKKNLV